MIKTAPGRLREAAHCQQSTDPIPSKRAISDHFIFPGYVPSVTFPKEDIVEKTAYLQSLAVILSAAARRADALAPRLHDAAIHAAAGDEAMAFGAAAGLRAEIEAVLTLVAAAEALRRE